VIYFISLLQNLLHKANSDHLTRHAGSRVLLEDL